MIRVPARVLVYSFIWLCLIACGTLSLAAYSNRAGASSNAGPSWPTGSLLLEQPRDSTVVLFLHPRCPCSRATVRELKGALSVTPAPLRVCVVVFAPAGESEQWSQTDLLRQAGSLPGASVFIDIEGKEAERFGIRTSGHVLLYSPMGKLVYSGGVTPSRGHEGENAGIDAVRRFVSGRTLPTSEAAVFGCPILHAEEACGTREVVCSQEGEPCH
ncbi:MAG: hypothetical protein H7210_05980 [Pyrinomonadaceae bacterium]|nr:hypothetical protein [Phycisphaerales bacterium]